MVMMNRTLNGMAGAFLAIVSIGCSSEEENEEQAPSGDASAILRNAQDAMRGLDSYRQELSLSPERKIITFVADYVAPASWYERLAEGPGIDSVVELVQADGSIYVRHCADYPDECGQWESSDWIAAAPSLGGLTGTVPETLGLTSLGMVTDPEVLGSESANGRQLLRVRGSLNLARAIYDNQSLAFHGAEVSGETCETHIQTGATPTSVCRKLPKLTFEEAYEEEHGEVDFDQAPPSRIDILLDPEDFRVYRILISVPQAEDDPYLEVDYSDFNDVTVEVPEDAVPAP
jgi:hypothetical protein